MLALTLALVVLPSPYEIEREKYLAMLFLCINDMKRYGGVLDRLEKQMNLGIDQYPLTTATVFDLLVREVGTFSNGYSNSGN